MTNNIPFKPVGIIRTPFKRKTGMPIQPTGVEAAAGEIHIYPEFAAGIRDIEGFSHIILLFHFHKVKTAKLTVIPFLDTLSRGVFATRAPARPNPIGLSIVEIDRVIENVIHLKKIDVLDETPLLDIKPFIPTVDTPVSPVRTGWLEKASKNVPYKKSDNRF